MSLRRLVPAVLTIVAVAVLMPSLHAMPADENGGDTLEQFVRKCQVVVDKERLPATEDLVEHFTAGLDTGQCTGYLSGVLELHTLIRNASPASSVFCVPSKGITVYQAVKILLKHAHEHPEYLHQPVLVQALLSLAVAFPCKETRSKGSQ